MASDQPTGRRHVATDSEVEAALAALDGTPLRLRASDWPADLRGLGNPGLYSWWVDDVGAVDLTTGLGNVVQVADVR